MTTYKRIISIDEEQLKTVHEHLENKTEGTSQIPFITYSFPNYNKIVVSLVSEKDNPFTNENTIMVSLVNKEGKIIEKRLADNLINTFSFTDFVGNTYTPVFALNGIVEVPPAEETQSYDNTWSENNGIALTGRPPKRVKKVANTRKRNRRKKE